MKDIHLNYMHGKCIRWAATAIDVTLWHCSIGYVFQYFTISRSRVICPDNFWVQYTLLLGLNTQFRYFIINSIFQHFTEPDKHERHVFDIHLRMNNWNSIVYGIALHYFFFNTETTNQSSTKPTHNNYFEIECTISVHGKNAQKCIQINVWTPRICWFEIEWEGHFQTTKKKQKNYEDCCSLTFDVFNFWLH